MREYFKTNGYDKVVFFQTRNPLHRSHFELTSRAAKAINGKVVLHPSVGMTKPGDVDHYTRVRCYENLLSEYKNNEAILVYSLSV